MNSTSRRLPGFYIMAVDLNNLLCWLINFFRSWRITPPRSPSGIRRLVGTSLAPHHESHPHAEFYPPYRTSDRLKYLADTELAASMFASDTLPEHKTQELQAVQVHL